MDAVILLKTMHTRIATLGMALVHGSVHTSVPSVSGLGQMHLKNDVHCAPMQDRLTRHSVDCHSLWMIYKHYASYCPHIPGDLECVVDRAARQERNPHTRIFTRHAKYLNWAQFHEAV